MGYIPTRMIATNSMAGFCRELKKVLKCIVISAKCITVDELNQDFIDVEGRAIPYIALSCSTLMKYVESLNDIFSVEPSTGIISLVNMDVPELNKSLHIRKLVEKQYGKDRECFVYPENPTKQLPRWTIMDIICQFPAVDFVSQLNIVVHLNRNKGGLTVAEFEAAMVSVLEIHSVKKTYESVERLLDKLQHLLRISGDRIYPDLGIYSAEINTLGLDRYHVQEVSVVPDSVKNGIVEILEGESHGMWAQFLPKKYEERFGFPLDFWTFGFTTVTQFLGTIPQFVRMRRFENLFRIYATKNPYPPEPGVPTSTVQNMLKLLARFVEGVDIHYFDTMYRMLLNEPLVMEPLGFGSVLEALESLASEGIILEKVEQETVAKLKTRTMARAIRIVRPFSQKNIDALPIDLYPSGVMRPRDNVITGLFLDEDLKPGAIVQVEMQAIYGPAGFFVHLKNGYCKLIQEELNTYYKEHGAALVMPDNACVESLFCIYKSENSYKRVLIVAKGVRQCTVKVLMIDYGHIVTVHLGRDYLYYMDTKFARIPNQAIFCYIPNIEPANFLPVFTSECMTTFNDLVKDKTLQAKVYKLNHRNIEMAIFLNDVSSGKSVDIRRVLIDNYFANVTFKKPRCNKRLYALWSLFTRLSP